MAEEFVFAGVAREKGGYLVLVLGGEDGAGGVEEFSAGFQHLRVGLEELGLDGADAFQGGGFEAPFEVWLAFQCAEAGAGGINEEGVADAGEVFGGGLCDELW